MSNNKRSGSDFMKKLDAFTKSKNFLPTMIGVTAVIIAIIAGIAVAVIGRGDKAPAQDSGEESFGNSSILSDSDWSEPEDDSSYDAEENKLEMEKFSDVILPKTKDAGQQYLDETLFLGDSNTVRYMVYSRTDSSKQPFTTVDNNIGVVSMGVQDITTLKCEQFAGYSEEVTMPQAVKIMQPRRIIIGFGTNNLTSDTASFIKTYRKGLKAVHDAYPYADIIVNAIPPLDKQRENTRLSMKDVDRLNAAIAKMCEEEGYKYLDSSEALKDPRTGWAKKDYTMGDGVHLSQKGVRAFFEYVQTHAYITEDSRPKPLKKIPKVKGVTPGLIQNDPIAVRGARVPVEFVASEGGIIEGQTSQKVKKGQNASAVKAVANEGWAFDSWSCTIGRIERVDDPTLTFTVPGNADANGVIITANFKRLVCTCRNHCDPSDPNEWNRNCPVCKDHPENCQGCICKVHCDPGSPNPNCPYCQRNPQDCQGCTCTKWCDPSDPSTWNSSCPVCGLHPDRCQADKTQPTASPSPSPSKDPNITPTPDASTVPTQQPTVTPAVTPDPTPAATPVPVPTDTPAPPPADTPVPDVNGEATAAPAA